MTVLPYITFANLPPIDAIFPFLLWSRGNKKRRN
jgi:hypothetical protein